MNIAVVMHLLLILPFFIQKGNASLESIFNFFYGDSPTHHKRSNNKSDPVEKEISPILKILRKRDTGENKGKASSNDATRPICSDEKMMVFLAEVQAVNPESIINLATADSVNTVCKQLSETLDEVDSYLMECKVPHGFDLYLQLIKGIDKLNKILCSEKSVFKEEFEEQSSCLQELHDDFANCFGPPDWTEDIKKKDICKAFKEISDCYYVKTYKVCGPEAAKVMKKLVCPIISSIITTHCSITYPKMENLQCSSSRSQFNNYQILIQLIIILYNLLSFIFMNC